MRTKRKPKTHLRVVEPRQPCASLRVSTKAIQGYDKSVFYCTPLEDHSLYDDDIDKGDVVVVRNEFQESELTPGRLVVAETPLGVMCRHLYRKPNGRIVLWPANEESYVREFWPAECSISGIVTAVYDSRGREKFTL